MSKHKHKWYKTTLIQEQERQSYACECGQWKIENIADVKFIEIKPSFFKRLRYKIKLKL